MDRVNFIMKNVPLRFSIVNLTMSKLLRLLFYLLIINQFY